jgi:peptidyl-prolyl cis-trans isomerase SurA
MDPALSAQVYNLKEGEVSEVFTERDRTGRSKFKVLSVTKKIEEHPADYARDYEKIQELALKQKQILAIEAWQKEKILETYVNVNEDYRDCEYASNWVKK